MPSISALMGESAPSLGRDSTVKLQASYTNSARICCRVTPRISMRFVRLLSPLRILTADLGVFKSCARHSTSASFALSSTAGARGRTLTRKKRVPLVWFSEISNIQGLPAALVLHRRFDLLTKNFRRAPWPIRITQHFARKKDQIRLFAHQDRLRLSRFRDQAHRARRYSGLLSDRFGKLHLVAGTQRNLDAGNGAPARNVYQINFIRLQLSRKLNRLLQIPAAFLPVCCGQANE